MIKELIYTDNNKTKSLLAKEKTVKLLFNGSYAEYLNYRLKNNEVSLVKVQKYEKKQQGPFLLVLNEENQQNTNVAVQEMELAERKITIARGIETVAKYKEKIKANGK